MTSQLVLVPFYGDVLEATQDDAGAIWVSLRRLCDNLGIDVENQRKKLAAKRKPVTVMITVTASDGKNYSTSMIAYRAIPLWLATISPNKVKPEVRPKLERYQDEVEQVLADHFLGKNGSPFVGDPIKAGFDKIAEFINICGGEFDKVNRRVDGLEQRMASIIGPPAPLPSVSPYRTLAQKQSAIVAELRKNPHRSNGEIAAFAYVSTNAVENHRKAMVHRGEIPHVDDRICRDGKTRNSKQNKGTPEAEVLPYGEKKRRIENLLLTQSQYGNPYIAERAGASPGTVGEIRSRMEKDGRIPKHQFLLDGAGRKRERVFPGVTKVIEKAEPIPVPPSEHNRLPLGFTLNPSPNGTYNHDYCG